MIRRYLFGAPQRPLPPMQSRVEIFQPTRGYHGGIPAQKLEAGYTPFSQNVVAINEELTARSGLSRLGSNLARDPIVGGMEALDVYGQHYNFAGSLSTLMLMTPLSTDYSALSYVRGPDLAADNIPAAQAVDGWDCTYIYEPQVDENMLIATNQRYFPKHVWLRESETTYSDFTCIFSFASTANAVTAFDARLVWFGTANSTASYPTRVMWSARGLPTVYSVASGGGYEDLTDMRGTATRVLPEQDSVLLFSTEEIWRGRRRDDVYAFNFGAVQKGLGCPFPRTVVQTPYGVVFLGSDLEVYIMVGNNVPQPLGPAQAGEPSRIQSTLRTNLRQYPLAWAAYNSMRRRYELYYADSTSGLWPNRALFYCFDNNAWFPQLLTHELSFGYDAYDHDGAATWDSMANIVWDELAVSWDEIDRLVSSNSRSIHVWASRGTSYRFRSSQTNDDATAIDCRWRSHAMNQQDQMRYETLSELWLEYNAASASSVSVWLSEDAGATFYTDPFQLNLSASSQSVLFAPVLVTSQSPTFELRWNDGGRPNLNRLQAHLRDAGAFHGLF